MLLLDGDSLIVSLLCCVVCVGVLAAVGIATDGVDTSDSGNICEVEGG